jgi:4-oxalocrotonate tautomerase
MPLIRISLRNGATQDTKTALIDGIQQALVEAFDIPTNDRFAFVDEYDQDAMVFPSDFLGRHYSQRLVVVSVTVSEGRTSEQKNSLFAAIARNLSAGAGIDPTDVLVSLVETSRENWSFGDGVPLYGT